MAGRKKGLRIVADKFSTPRESIVLRDSEIKKLRSEGWKISALAERYNLNKSTISRICNPDFERGRLYRGISKKLARYGK